MTNQQRPFKNVFKDQKVFLFLTERKNPLKKNLLKS